MTMGWNETQTQTSWANVRCARDECDNSKTGTDYEDCNTTRMLTCSQSVSSRCTHCWVSWCAFVLILCFVSSIVFLSLWSSTQYVSQILAYFTSRKRVFWGVVFTHTVGYNRPPSAVNDLSVKNRMNSWKPFVWFFRQRSVNNRSLRSIIILFWWLSLNS